MRKLILAAVVLPLALGVTSAQAGLFDNPAVELAGVLDPVSAKITKEAKAKYEKKSKTTSTTKAKTTTAATTTKAKTTTASTTTSTTKKATTTKAKTTTAATTTSTTKKKTLGDKIFDNDGAKLAGKLDPVTGAINKLAKSLLGGGSDAAKKSKLEKEIDKVFGKTSTTKKSSTTKKTSTSTTKKGLGDKLFDNDIAKLGGKTDPITGQVNKIGKKLFNK